MVADGRNRNAIETRKGKSRNSLSSRRNDTLKERNDVGVTLLTSLCESLGTFFLRQHIEGHEVSHHFQVALKTRRRGATCCRVCPCILVLLPLVLT